MKHWIGIDISKCTLDLALIDEQGAHKVSSTIEHNRHEILKVIGQWKKRYGVNMENSLICFESTGYYTRELLQLGLAKGWQLWQAHPLDIKRSMGVQRSKNDKIDAIRIAEYARAFASKKRLYTSRSLDMIEMRDLLTRREYLVRQRSSAKAHISDINTYTCKETRKLFDQQDKKRIEFLGKQLLKLDSLINKKISSNDEFIRQFDLLQTIPGIGERTAIELLVHTEAFAKFSTPREVACHAGVAPFQRTSGTSLRGRSRVSHQANKKLKTKLHLAAMAAVQSKGDLQDYYQRKVKEGKNKMSVLNAVRNKLIHRAFAVVRNDSPYVL